MNCPYCGKELISGFIYGGKYGVNYSFKWLPASKQPTLAALELEGEPVGEHSIMSEPKISCLKCRECKKIIIDLEE